MTRLVKIGDSPKNEYLVNLDKVDFIQEIKQQGYEDVIIHFSNKENLLLQRIGIACVLHQIEKSK